ncbi:MAG: hypothetical protein AB7K68_08425 [Bacteriovoracia bacterium]
MPAKKSKAPKATLPKRFLHTFYLVQPVLQFMALVSLMLVLSRCSPLAPSTEKEIGPRAQPTRIGFGNNEELLRENAISGSMNLLSSERLSIISESDFALTAAPALQAERNVREEEVKLRFNSRKKIMGGQTAKKRAALFAVNLSVDQQQALWREGFVRIALNDYLQANFENNARKALYNHLLAELKELRARSFAVISDDAATHNGAEEVKVLEMDLKISLGFPSEDKGYLEIRRGAEDSASVAALTAAAQSTRKLAVVLE